jgi:TPR repeat protein
MLERNTTMFTRLKMIAAAILISLTAMPFTVVAQDFDKGMAALMAKDYATALKEWMPLVEQGDAAAQNSLGFMYDNGKGVPQDFAEAVKWYRLAAEQGFAKAQYNLGEMYDNGEGVPQDDVEAVKWYRLAAQQGDAEAQNTLGLMYGNGYGVVQDFALAYMWLNVAAANENDNGSKNRDIVAVKMTPAEISKAQTMAKDCMANDYKNCGD